MSLDWDSIATQLIAETQLPGAWRYGQERTLQAVANRLRHQAGVLIADDVGLGKTRVALAVVRAVISQGGTAAVLAPPGLLYQWEQEWHQYAPKAASPAIIRSYDQCLRSARQTPDGARQWPLLGSSVQSAFQHPWAIISHRFGAPLLRTNSQPDRFGLPALTLALHRLPTAARGFRNTSLWRLALDIAGDCLEEPCGEHECWSCDLVAAARFLGTHGPSGFLDLEAERCVTPAQAKPYLTSVDEKRGIFLEAIRSLIGAADLVVIDEAHKSRGVGDEESILSELIHEIVPTSGRRIALTATPIELDPAQWQEVLRRAGVAHPPMPAILAFGQALAVAQAHPDRADAIHRLLTTATAFGEALRPFVVRRRRITQEAMRRLVGNAPGAHPHRSHQLLPIPFAAIAPAWRPIVLALEGLGKAAKGSSAASLLRTVDRRYAAGHITSALLDPDGEAGDDPVVQEPDDPTGKRARMAYWQTIARSGIAADPNALGSHPRVTTVAGRIDGLLHGAFQQEKILVFGVYTRPLRALVEALNRRALLRMVDRDIPFPFTDTADEIARLWAEYRAALSQVTTGLPGACAYTGLLAERVLDPSALQILFTSCGRRYESLREGLQRSIDRKFLGTLPGDGAIDRLTGDDQESLLKLLRSRLVTGLVMASSTADTMPVGDREHYRQAAQQIWIDDFLKPCRDQDDELDDAVVLRTPWKGESGLADLDRMGDALDERRLKRVIADEAAVGLERFSAFARLLIGDTHMETRRSLQAQFNRPSGFPRVLVAQSQVGREGLNLQTACRRVIVFNAEWNPGVLEQQIGRVDRIESLWEQKAEAWLQEGKPNVMPKIEIEHTFFEGTYDAYQWGIVAARQRGLHAQLHGELLDADAMAYVPEDLREQVARGAPQFEPIRGLDRAQ